MSKARVRMRVAKGGHNIPVADIERRFSRSLDNLRSLYISLVDNWDILDGTHSPARLIASGDSKRVDIFDETLYARIIKP
jgi:predicted ABC-type ATPase